MQNYSFISSSIDQVDQDIKVNHVRTGSSSVVVTLGEDVFSVNGSVPEAARHALMNTSLMFR